MTDQQHYAKNGQCAECRQQAPCQWIAAEASREWREIAEALPGIRAYLEPGRTGTRGGSRPAPASRTPLNEAASDLIREIEDWAWFYASALMDETKDYTAPTDPAQRLRDIAERYGHFTETNDERWVEHKRRDPNMPSGHWQRIALDYCDIAHELHRKAVTLIAQPTPPRFMGPCMTGECRGDVYLKAHEKMPRCLDCDQGHDHADLRIQMWRALEARLLRRDELREALNMLRDPSSKRIKPGLVRLWIHRGRLVPVIQEPELFRLTDAMDLAGIEIAA